MKPKNYLLCPESNLGPSTYGVENLPPIHQGYTIEIISHVKLIRLEKTMKIIHYVAMY